MKFRKTAAASAGPDAAAPVAQPADLVAAR